LHTLKANDRIADTLAAEEDVGSLDKADVAVLWHGTPLVGCGVAKHVTIPCALVLISSIFASHSKANEPNAHASRCAGT
jgi:hypothetical protein